MKQKFPSFILLFLIVCLLSFSQITASILSMKQGEGEMKNLDENSLLSMETTDSLDKLMGLEECENRDQECFNRRVLAETHLDYIYTQHHKEP